MARRKEEVVIVHPRISLESLQAFVEDANLMLAAARNAHSFLSDDDLDPQKVMKAIAPSLKEAIERMERHFKV